MITDIKFECSSCGQRMLVDAEAAGMHADCPSCGTAVTIPRVRALNDRDYAPVKPARKREGSRNAPAVVGKNSSRRNGSEPPASFTDPELSDLRQELLDASVQTSAIERELADARAEVDRLKSEVTKGGT